MITAAQVFGDGKHFVLRQIGNAKFNAAVFPPRQPAAGGESIDKVVAKPDGVFQNLAWSVPERKIVPELVQTRAVGKAPEPLLGPRASWRKSAVAMTPEEASFAQAGEWRVTVPADAVKGLSDVFLSFSYQGDEARLLAGNRLLTDNFYNGTDWKVGLKRFLAPASAGTFTFQVLPLKENARIFFEPGMAPRIGKEGQAGSLQSIEAFPEYETRLPLASRAK